MGINQVLSLVHRSKTKEGRTLPLNANNLPRKDPIVGINRFEGVRPEWLLPKRNPYYVLEESRIWKGREENRPTGACPLYYLSFFLNFLSFFPPFSFLSFFLFFYSVFFSLREYSIFSILFSGHDKGPFIVPAVTNFLPLCPLTAFVWSGRTCQLPKGSFVCHSFLPDKGRFVSFVSPP